MKAVVLAGGKGARLAPYTKILPKPLMPIGDMPILEVILRQMKASGVDKVILTVVISGGCKSNIVTRNARWEQQVHLP